MNENEEANYYFDSFALNSIVNITCDDSHSQTKLSNINLKNC
jgi:hypothetical protein